MKQPYLPFPKPFARRKSSVVSRPRKEPMFTPAIQGLPPAIIKAQLQLRHGTIEIAAGRIGEDATRVSETINRGGSRGGRKNERCRVKLCLDLNQDYAALWGGEPNWNYVTKQVRAEYEARFTPVKDAAASRERVNAAA
jgi:hypothetical protein